MKYSYLKNHIVVLSFFLFPIYSFSDVESKNNDLSTISESKHKVYCELTYMPITRNAMVNIGTTVDVIRDPKGEPIEFMNTMEAVNYMAKLGWEIAEVYGIPKGNDKATFIFMEKEVTMDAEAIQGLNLKSMKCQSADACRLYLKEYPQGRYENEIQEKLNRYVRDSIIEVEENIRLLNNTASTNTLSYSVNGVHFGFVFVKGSTFTMGATHEQGNSAYDWELPTHKVTLSDFYIGETEVTQALWNAVMGTNPSNWIGDSLPVERVSWNDCQIFIRKLNSVLSVQLAGKQFRLPTEAEWEYAARGGQKSKRYKYSGSNDVDDVAWYDDNSENKTHPVAQKQANELGIFDMSGNVYEWCSDWYGDYQDISSTNPQGSQTGTGRVGRSGSWYSRAKHCRVSSRDFNIPENRRSSLGLRLVLN